jgi:predicted amidophosphoribosyltransferase
MSETQNHTRPGLPPTRCPECAQPAPADARFCPHCRHSFALYAKPPSLPPVPTGRKGWWARLTGRGG